MIGFGFSMARTIGPATSGLDSDAAAFIAASGATDTAAINNWVVQMKAAGLWSFIRAYPMRSGQNSASGTTVYGLGGLNSANGTLVNSPTRQTDGIQFLSASSQRMDVAISSFNSRYSMGAAVTMLTTGGAGSCIMAINGTGGDSMQLNDSAASVLAGGHRQVAGSTYVAVTAQSFTASTPTFISQGWDGSSTVRRSTDGANVSASSAAFGGALTPLRLNARGDATTPIGQNKRFAFAYYMVGAGGTDAEHATLRSIYKATLGSGLSLP